LTDSCIKNTGDHFLVELASREFVDTVGSLVKFDPTITNQVREMAANYLQLWAHLCRHVEGLGYFWEAYEEHLRNGVTFPPPPRNVNQSLVKTSAVLYPVSPFIFINVAT
jgi:growth factor-regulated tyrosine kinase substrate